MQTLTPFSAMITFVQICLRIKIIVIMAKKEQEYKVYQFFLILQKH